MNRKTNLFYTSGNDSSFLTFSNYTEHMTGVYLSTEHKLFPSRFLCLYSERLNSNFELEKENLIKNYLVGYYENKLAFLRDKLIAEGKDPDMNMLYFNYLIEALQKYDSDCIEEIHIGEISEQDYNGTFADIICTIDSNEIKKGYIVKIGNKDKQSGFQYDYSERYLYGWYNTDNDGNETPNCPTVYEGVTPLFEDDINKQYFLDTNFLELNFNQNKKTFDIEFNIIIPLYDCININYETNTNIIIENEPINIQKPDEYAKLVPYGIWTTQHPVNLQRDAETGYGQSWSLVIGTQFKPFPNSKLLVTDDYQSETAKSFSTFAYVLANQNNLVEQINKYSIICNSLIERVVQLEKTINTTIGNSKIADLEEEIKNIKQILSSGSGSGSVNINKNKWEIAK